MAALTLTVALVAGCAINRSATADGAPLARQVTESDHCGLTAPGLVYVSNAEDLDKLAQLPTGNLALSMLRAIDFTQEHLVLVGLGQKTTGGYGLTLQSSEIVDDVLELMVKVRRPAAGAMVTQALTTPCAVIAISPDDWEQLRVSGNGLKGFSRQR
ncbi:MULTISPECIES: protease complex subunit PrcB family protein [Marinobacter]|uniref:protease complex subunit PrcB family protein n=3 Tax=Marinobacteraceae TaxID=2887365 RepID=UPI002943DA38|nr:protease complex subunit PrcB family protein [Marinobacter salarius]WOI21152.1 protease complex subunit PrcB family protein [Marinobacter salarius]|tara:strand:- start:1090 stop:1560 length:471 start_codon:yes stop_codon:yes gene_type:complete